MTSCRIGGNQVKRFRPEISVYELFGCIRSVVSATSVRELQLFVIKNKFVIGVGGRAGSFVRELLMGDATGCDVY